MKISPTQIETFDEKTFFGCERKWFFEYAPNGPKIKREQGPEALLGDAVHKLIEGYFKQEEVKLENPGLFDTALTIVRSGADEIESVQNDEVVDIEQRIKFDVKGVTISGRLDCRTKRGIVDWKTTKSLRYAKTGDALRTNHQMLSYGMHEVLVKGAQELTLKHVTFLTVQPFGAKVAATHMTAAEIEKGFTETTLPVVERIALLYNEADVKQFNPKRGEHCRRCPFYSQCPSKESELAMSMSDWLRKRAAGEVPQVVPPDAPAPLPVAVGEEPPPAIEAPKPTPEVPEAPKQEVKRRGRPPGSMNKPKPSAPAPVAVVSGPAPSQPAEVAVKSISFTYGYTVNVGDYSNVQMSCTMSGEVVGNVDEAMEKLKHQVKSQLVDELELASQMRAAKVGK